MMLGGCAMTQTRRLAAIMAVDVVGFSLMGEDGSGAERPVGERRTVQFVTRLLLRMVSRCLGYGGHETHFLGTEVRRGAARGRSDRCGDPRRCLLRSAGSVRGTLRNPVSQSGN